MPFPQILPLRQVHIKAQDLAASKNIHVDALQTVCLMLGPYRNLTALTASVLFLHPYCQVLNRGYKRIFNVCMRTEM